MPAFLERVAATVAAHQMVSPGQTVLVALSAGADSTALLHALTQLRARLACQVSACHVHHGLRGEEADEDAQHAADLARSLGAPFVTKRTDVRALAAKRRLSLEAAAREARYRLLEEAATEMRADRIATGHTADDQAETVLLNLLRGAGLAGLAGIPPVRGRVIRPLLEVTRAQVAAYCRSQELSYRMDQSNLDRRFTRNRVRHEILPALRQLQPRADAILCRLSRIARDEEAFMAEEASRRLDEIAFEGLEGLVVPLEPFQALPPALRRRLARAAIAGMKGDELDIGLERVDALVKLATSGQTGTHIELPGRLHALRTYGEVIIHRIEETITPPTRSWALPLPGRLVIPELATEMAVTLSTAKRPPGASVALLDRAKVTEELRVRTWRPGDRFVPYGMKGSVKLQDFFVNQKVPRRLRGWVPLVLCGERIAWVVCYRVSDEFKVTPETRRTVRIEARSRVEIEG